jgi:hypothetical protein
MMKWIVLALGLAVASSAQAMPHAVLQPADDMIIQVRQGCGLGRQLVDGVCVRNSAVRAAVRKCQAKKMRMVNGRCVPRAQQRPPAQPPSSTPAKT